MPNPHPTALEACRTDLFTSEDELKEKYPLALAERIMRLRKVYNYWLSNPSAKDREIRAMIVKEFGVSQSAAYADMQALHQLVPLVSRKSREFHRERAGEMFMEAYALAKEHGDIAAMVRAAASYAKTFKVDADEEVALPYDEIVQQPFCATIDVRVLGIEPIPNASEYIARLVKELGRDFREIEEVSYEEIDLEERFIFPETPGKGDTDGDTDQPEG